MCPIRVLSNFKRTLSLSPEIHAWQMHMIWMFRYPDQWCRKFVLMHDQSHVHMCMTRKALWSYVHVRGCGMWAAVSTAHEQKHMCGFGWCRRVQHKTWYWKQSWTVLWVLSILRRCTVLAICPTYNKNSRLEIEIRWFLWQYWQQWQQQQTDKLDCFTLAAHAC